MPYEEVKSERYSNLGGLNTKVSRYLSGQQEVIRLVNYDYSTPGSFTKRPDTATFLGTSFGSKITGLKEIGFPAVGASYVLVQSASGLFSVGSFGVTQLFMTNTLTGGNDIQGASGHLNAISYDSQAWIANQWSLGVTGLGWYRYNGNVVVKPQFYQSSGFGSGSNGISYVAGSSPVYFATLNSFRWSSAYVGDRTYAGVQSAFFLNKYLGNGGFTTVSLDISTSRIGGQLATAFYASYLLVYRETFAGATAAAIENGAVSITTAIFRIPIADAVTHLIDTGQATASYLLGSSAAIANYKINRFLPFSLTPAPTTATPIANEISSLIQTGQPSIINTYNNMMFYMGFGGVFGSHVFWSELGIPERVSFDSVNEVRSNDGDIIRGAITYGGQQVIGKQFSLYSTTGDDPDTVSFSDVSKEYGFMNNRAFCIWEDILWFLDGSGKGVCQYNGANTSIVSIPVEDIFKRINLNAAFDEAWMLHVKSRNEVWCGIPVDSSALVNTIVVYDYVSKVWTTYEGLSPTAITIARGTLSKPSVVMGFSNGTIKSLNATFMGTEAVTTAVRFPFVSNFGWSSTETYRRFFLDVDPIVGVTHSFAINYYLNQSNTVSQTGTISTSAFQTRTDFGLPGKGLSVELVAGSSLPVKINGYTIESRFQRNV